MFSGISLILHDAKDGSIYEKTSESLLCGGYESYRTYDESSQRHLVLVAYFRDLKIQMLALSSSSGNFRAGILCGSPSGARSYYKGTLVILSFFDQQKTFFENGNSNEPSLIITWQTSY